MEMDILENSSCIINRIIISKLVLGPWTNLVSSGASKQKKEYFPLKESLNNIHKWVIIIS